MATIGLVLLTRLHSMRTASLSVALTSAHRTTTIVGLALRAGIGLEENNEIIQRREGGSISM